MIYNYALKDYKSPIEEFVRFCDENKNNRIDADVGNTLLVYIHSSLGMPHYYFNIYILFRWSTISGQ